MNDDKVEDAAGRQDASSVSGVAPDLTHLMTRGTFAGSIFNLYVAGPATADDRTGDAADAPARQPDEALLGGQRPLRSTGPTLEAWLRNPPAMKPMYAARRATARYRGMPNLGLTEDQIDQLVAYLETLK